MLRTRIAPTPSGLLHVGNGVSFVVTWAIARAQLGDVLLRIDDLDRSRMRDAYLHDIFATLRWLRIAYDRGPISVADFHQDWSQITRLPHYQRSLANLRQSQQLYACVCTRKDIRTHNIDGRYPGTCRERKLPLETPNAAWRIHVPDETKITIREASGQHFVIDLSKQMGDFVVRQKNGMPAYQLASLVDDQVFGINYIVRGEDLLNSTAAQLFLAEKLNLEAFRKARFFHHPLLKDEAGAKLSKSKGSKALISGSRMA